MFPSSSASCLAVVAVLGACKIARTVAPAPQCISSWHPVWTADSSVALCIPPGFVLKAPDAWGRPRTNGTFSDFLTVELLLWPEDSATLSRWPPHLASGTNCLADCATADSVVIHRDTVAGTEVAVEVGLVTGGYPGFRRQPLLVVGWTVSNTRRAFAQGWAVNPTTLDTLRNMLKTVSLPHREH
jgi:hypothetical protein